MIHRSVLALQLDLVGIVESGRSLIVRRPQNRIDLIVIVKPIRSYSVLSEIQI